MALTFAAGSLTNWGFGVGDIAVLAGAGRNVGNWVMAQTRDRNLVDFLRVDIDTIITRKGLIDMVELHKRWDRRLTLFRNGRPIAVEHPGSSQTPVVENMDKFTWFMTLVLATLDATIGSSFVHGFVADLLSRLFKDSPEGMEYLMRETPQHLLGWRSSASVRGMILKTERLWKQLAQRREHWPGWIPPADNEEIMRLLLWLTTESSRQFTTASTDTFCFAMILREIGMEQITTVKIIDDEVDLETNESEIYVVLNTKWSSMPSREAKVAEDTFTKRNGMTVPLSHMDECMSLWPTGRHFAAHLRVMFEKGVGAVQSDGLIITAPNIQNWDFDYLVSKRKPSQRTANFRSDNLTHRVIEAFLPVVSNEAGRKIQDLLRGWDARQCEDLKTYTENKTQAATLYLRPAALAELQAFLLGYYYELLRPLVDCSRLSVQEVYGAWGYTSSAFLTALSRLKRPAIHRPLNDRSQHEEGKEDRQFYQREAILYLVAFLFAGAGPDSGAFVRGSTGVAITSATSTIGILSKLTVLPMVMLGSQLEPQHAWQLCLLDCDTSFIPSNTSGCVQEGLRSYLIATDVEESTETNFQGRELRHRFDSDNTEDFTPHIEPDWDNDVQCSILVYRHKDRIVSSMPSSSILAALNRDEILYRASITDGHSQPVPEAVRACGLQERVDNWATWADIELPACILSNTSMRAVLASPRDFHGNTILWNRARDGSESAIVVASLIGMPNAALCVLAMYSQQSEFLSLEDTVVVVSRPDEFAKALEAGKQYFIVF